MSPDLFIYAVPAFLLLMLVEWFADRRDPDRPANGMSGRDHAANIATYTIGLLYQFPIHTQRIGTMWRPIEFLFNTPAHHRVHHGSNQPYLDTNYGGVLIIWDRLFGSFAAESEPIAYGLTKNIGTDNPIKVNYAELMNLVRDVRTARTWKGRVAYIVGPPGWTESPAEQPVKTAVPV
ncbi:sterol desaturase family protein [Nocardia sp. NPDC052001]|uniref:sterol desaturase family protein n=1 Tax=Nocardia sp. NPDC052001 TaxID=3154853 RepID=UPI0034225C06